MFNLIMYLKLKHKVTKDLKNNHLKGDALVYYLARYTGDANPLTLYNKVIANHLDIPIYSVIGDLTTGKILVFFNFKKSYSGS